MTAVLGAACRCGAVIHRPAPAVADIPTANAEIRAAGWGYDGRGNVRCPACRDAPAAAIVDTPPPAPAQQGELFS